MWSRRSTVACVARLSGTAMLASGPQIACKQQPSSESPRQQQHGTNGTEKFVWPIFGHFFKLSSCFIHYCETQLSSSADAVLAFLASSHHTNKHVTCRKLNSNLRLCNRGELLSKAPTNPERVSFNRLVLSALSHALGGPSHLASTCAILFISTFSCPARICIAKTRISV